VVRQDQVTEHKLPSGWHSRTSEWERDRKHRCASRRSCRRSLDLGASGCRTEGLAACGSSSLNGLDGGVQGHPVAVCDFGLARHSDSGADVGGDSRLQLVTGLHIGADC
jgi:hypothetical protein